MQTLLNQANSFLDKDQRIQAVLLIAIMLVAAFTELLGLGLFLLLLNNFLGISNKVDGDYLNSFLTKFTDKINLNEILLLFFFIFTFKLLLQLFVTWNLSSFVAKLRERISLKLYTNFLKRDPSKLLSKNSSEYLRNFTDEIGQAALFYQSTISILLDFIIFLTFVSFLLFYNPFYSSIVIIFFSMIGLCFYLIFQGKLMKWAKKGIENRRKKIQFVNESFSAIKYIKIFSSENYFLRKFRIENISISKISFKYLFLSGIPRHLFEYTLFLSILLVLLFLLDLKMPNERILQMLGVYTLVAFRIIPIINKILVSAQHIRFTQPSFIKLYLEHQKPILSRSLNFKDFSFKKNIAIKIKKFKYESKKNFYLKNINLIISKGSKIGIIGSSGSGKSTIIDIICGFTKLNDGKILIDNKNIFENLEGWQNKIGYIPQNVVILNQSLRDNILFGSSSEKYTDTKIKKIIKQVKLDKFLQKLPNKLSQIIKQDGSNISGGEKQRIGIARALLRNPELILLDEATSGLDSFTEQKVLETIKDLQKTVIIVSHRINTLKFCDKVYRIDKSTTKLTNI